MEQQEEQVGAGHSCFDVDLFFDHVYNAAYDIFEDSFDTFEENVPFLLGNPNEEIMSATTMGFDAVFNTIQEKLEKNLNRWEEYSRANCFINIEEAPKYQEDAYHSDAAESSLRRQEENLDTELESVRSQLHAAGKESARIRRELRNFERHLIVKKRHEDALQDAVIPLKGEEHHDMLEELVRVASLLQEKLNKVKPQRMQSPRGVRWKGAGRAGLDMATLESTAKALNL